MTTTCEIFAERGSHSYTAAPGTDRDRNGDPVSMVCRYCPATLENNVPAPRIKHSDDWAAAIVGHIFVEDCNTDGSLKTEDN